MHLHTKKLLSTNTLLAAAAILLALTPFYGVAYVIALYFAIGTIRFSKFFSTVFSRIVLSVLLLCVSIMFTGLVAWVCHVQTYPSLVLVIFSLLLFALSRNQKTSSYILSTKFFDKSDAISIILALVAPLLIIASFYAPHPTNAATYQLLSTGWDNANHLVMLESNSMNHGYLYGPYEDMKDKMVLKANAYPQAWHLATSNIANGFGVNLFNPSKPIITINAYLGVLLLWFVIASYSITKVAWHTLRSLHRRLSNATDLKALDVILFSLAMTLIQLVVLWGSFGRGFADYIGCIAFLAVMAGMVIEQKTSETVSIQHYIFIITMGLGAILCWFLPVAAIGLSILLTSLHLKTITSLRKLDLKIALVPVVVTIFFLLAALLQIFIFIRYSIVSTASQLNAGVATGTFSINPTFVAVLVLLCAVYFLSVKTHTVATTWIKRFSIIVAPMVILGFAIYAYQILTTGQTSYYFGKILGLALVLTSVFFVPIFVTATSELAKRYKLPLLSVCLFGFMMISLLILATGQSTDGASRLFQRNSKVPTEVAVKVMNHLEHDNPNRTDLLIFTGNHNIDSNGGLYMTVTHQPRNCLYYSTSYHKITDGLSNLQNCLMTTNKPTTIISSPKTTPGLINFHNKDVSIEEVK